MPFWRLHKLRYKDTCLVCILTYLWASAGWIFLTLHTSCFIMIFSRKNAIWPDFHPLPLPQVLKYSSLADWGKKFTSPTEKNRVGKEHLQSMWHNRKGLSDYLENWYLPPLKLYFCSKPCLQILRELIIQIFSFYFRLTAAKEMEYPQNVLSVKLLIHTFATWGY